MIFKTRKYKSIRKHRMISSAEVNLQWLKLLNNLFNKIKMSKSVTLENCAGIKDTNENEVVKFSSPPGTSVTNQLTIENNSTGKVPTLAATGVSVDVNLHLKPQGSGHLIFGTGSDPAIITTAGFQDLILHTNLSQNSGLIRINHSASGNIDLEPDETGKVVVKGTGMSIGGLTLQDTEITSATGLSIKSLGGNLSFTAYGGSIVIGDQRWPLGSPVSGQYLQSSGGGVLTWADTTETGVSQTGDVVANQVTIWSGTSTIQGDSSLTFSNGTLSVGTGVSIGGLTLQETTITSTAGLSIKSTGGNLSFTASGASIVIGGIHWPVVDGVNGQFLQTDGSGNLSFANTTGVSQSEDVEANQITFWSGTSTITGFDDFTFNPQTSTFNINGGIIQLDTNVTLDGNTSTLDMNSIIISGDFESTITSTAGLSIKSTGGNLSFTAPGNSIHIGDIYWPAADGDPGQFLQTDGSGNLSFANTTGVCQSGAVEGNQITLWSGTSTIQGDSNLTFSSGTLSVDTGVSIGGLTLQETTITSAAGLSIKSTGGNLSLTAAGGGSIVIGENYWPAADGGPGQFLQTEGNGLLRWVENTSSGSSGVSGTGVENQVTIWSGTSTIRGDSNLTFNSTTEVLSVGTGVSVGGLTVGTSTITVTSGLSILDTTGAELVNFIATGSAVNELTIANAATSNPPILSATGDNSTIGIHIKPKGEGEVIIGSDERSTLTSNGTRDLELTTNSGTNSGTITIENGSNADISLKPNGTGYVVVGRSGSTGKITSNGTRDLELSTNSGTSSGTIIIKDGANEDITLVPNGAGSVVVGGNEIDNVTITSTGALTAAGLVTCNSGISVSSSNGTSGGFIDFLEGSSNGTSYVRLQAPGSLTSNVILTLPGTSGSNGQFLRTDGSGILSFADASSGTGTSLGALTDVLMDGTDFADSLLIQTNSNGASPTTGTLSSASNNIGIGKDVFLNLTSGIDNVGIGSQAGEDLTTGGYNVAVGKSSLSTETKGNGSVAVGFNALADQFFNAASFVNNTAVGQQAGHNITTAIDNTLVGALTGSRLTTDGKHVAVGSEALKLFTRGSPSTAIGYRALYNSNDTIAENAENTAVGYQAGVSVTTGTNNVLMGSQAGSSLAGSSKNVAFGTQALYSENEADGSTAIGYHALRLQDVSGSGNTGNVAVGYIAGTSVSTGVDNTLVGSSGGFSLTTSSKNVAFGTGALAAEDTADGSTAIGYHALLRQDAGTGNTGNAAVGYEAGVSVSTGKKNTLMGSEAGSYLTTGSDNTIIGYQAGVSSTTSTGLETGHENTIIGANAGYNLTTGFHNIIIGKDAAASTPGVSNEITLGGTSITALRCAEQTIATVSDGRDKKDVIDLPYGLDFVDKIRPVQFTWERRVLQQGDENHPRNGQKRAGFIAQELEAAMPNDENKILDLVYDVNPERIEAKYGNLIPIMCQAIKDLKAEVDELKRSR